jgi:microsomal dipeptidase-like Zn-dependent dipeptidase
MAGSAHGAEEYGLTDEGRELIRRCLAAGMIIDLAHASEQAIDDTLAMVDRPVLASHGGVRGTCDTARNLADRHVRAIAEGGGVIGIGVYKYATCGKKLEDTARAMRYVADLVGVEHVALGSDFDGAKTMIDATGLVMLTQALVEGGFTEDEIAGIMGGNALRVFRRTLPER